MARRLFPVVASLSFLLCVALLALWLWSERGGTLKTPPRPSNAMIQAQLARPVPGVNFRAVALVDALDFMRDMSGLAVVVDWPALESAGVNENSSLSLNASGLRLGEMLAGLAGYYKGSVFVTRDDMVVMTTRSALAADPALAKVSFPPKAVTPRDTRIREVVIGGDRWTATADHSVLFVWRNPVDPASAYQPPVVRSGNAEPTEFAGFAVRSLGYPFHSTQIEVPLWAPVVLTALLPLAWVVAFVRRRRRVGEARCRNCGYDLRATPGRCPECGSDAGLSSPPATS